MPNLTVTHEAPLELIRQHPALAVDLLRAFTGLTVSEQADIRLGPNSLNATAPAEFTADAVVVVADPDTGDPQVVIDPHHAPGDDGATPYLTLFLACLPALDLADKAVAERVLAAIVETGASFADRRKLSAIILKRASAAAQQILEDLMGAIDWKHEFTERFYNEGEAKGAIATKIADIMKVLGVRDLHPTKKQLARLAACTDLATLNRWFDRSLTAATATEVFAD